MIRAGGRAAAGGAMHATVVGGPAWMGRLPARHRRRRVAGARGGPRGAGRQYTGAQCVGLGGCSSVPPASLSCLRLCAVAFKAPSPPTSFSVEECVVVYRLRERLAQLQNQRTVRLRLACKTTLR